MDKKFTRRNFLEVSAAVAAGGFLLGCSSKSGRGDYYVPPLLETAPDGPELKAGLVGCGGRGTGAALTFLQSGPNLTITAIGDVLQDKLDACATNIEEETGVVVPQDNRFIGFDAYQKVIDSGVDIVLFATPPKFRPEHFEAAVAANKHCFLEKPVAVDPVGARSIMATARKAENLGLSVVCGTQRRHQHSYVETYKRVMDGAIGDIVSANVWWNGGQLWYRTKQDDWSDMEYMIRDWVNWCWLSGDHIVEQHVHNLDVVHWFTGMHPANAVGFGARQRRVTGDQFDMFSIDYSYDNGMHVHSMCRQIDGCVNNVSEYIMGTKGATNCANTIYDQNGEVTWKYEAPEQEDVERYDLATPYIQEHTDLVTAIRRDEPVVEAEDTAISTLVAVMGRESAYTGKEITWDEMMNSDMRLGPDTYAMGTVDLEAVVPVPGTA